MNTQAVAVSPGNTDVPSGPTVTAHQQAADAFVAAFKQLVATLPASDGQQVTNSRFVRAHLNVTEEFLKAAIDTLDKLPQVQGVAAFDVAGARDMLQKLDAWTPVVNQILSVGTDLQYAMWVIRAALIDGALRTYYVTKRLAKDESIDGPVVAGSHAATMKKTLGRAARVKKTKSQMQQAARKAETKEVPKKSE